MEETYNIHYGQCLGKHVVRTEGTKIHQTYVCNTLNVEGQTTGERKTNCHIPKLIIV